MGISYSSENASSVDLALFDEYLDNRKWLRFCSQHAKLLVTNYLESSSAPFLNKYHVECFIVCALRPVQVTVLPTSVLANKEVVRINDNSPLSFSNESKSIIVNSIWKVFNVQQRHILVQEWLAVIVLLSSESWQSRAALIFDIFKCSCSEAIGYDEIAAGSQIVVNGLARLWEAEPWKNDDLVQHCTSLADHCYTKLGIDLEEDVQKSDFVLWLTSRFKESNAVLTILALKCLVESPFEQSVSSSDMNDKAAVIEVADVGDGPVSREGGEDDLIEEEANEFDDLAFLQDSYEADAGNDPVVPEGAERASE